MDLNWMLIRTISNKAHLTPKDDPLKSTLNDDMHKDQQSKRNKDMAQ